METKLIKQEAVRRLKTLKVLPNIVKEFKEGTINYSERLNSFMDGVLYWLDNKPSWYGKVKEFEKEYGVMVYHCQLTHTEFGHLLSLLFVSQNEEEWPYELDDNGDGTYYVNSYVINLSEPLYSEFGTIQIQPKNGGITRLA